MIYKKLSFLFFTIFIISFDVIAQQSNDELFHKVFKRAPIHEHTVILPLEWNAITIGEIRAKIKGNKNLISIDSNSLKNTLFKIIRPEIAKKINDTKKHNGYIPLESFFKNGIKLIYIYQKLRIKVIIPSDKRKKTINGLDDNSVPDWAFNALGPDKYSSYLNYTISRTFSNNHSTPNQNQTQLDTDLGIHFNKIILENSLDYQSQEQHKLFRKSTRIIRDDVKRGVRYSVGDIICQAENHYEMCRSTSGISAQKEFSILPYQKNTPISQTEFKLKNDSKVTVFINGRKTRILNLMAGKHSVTNLPLVQGINDVRLEIESNTGEKEVLFFPSTMSYRQLRTGRHKFQYNIGVERSETNRQTIYNESKNGPLIHLNHSFGLNARTTIGSFAQKIKNQTIFGFDVIWSNPLGIWGLETAGSKIGHTFGAASKATYTYSINGNKSMLSRDLKFSLEYLSGQFTRFADTLNENFYNWGIGTSYGQQLTDRISSSIGFDYWPGTDNGKEDMFNFFTYLSFSIINSIHGNIQFTSRENQDSKRASEIFLFLVWRPPQTNQSVNTYGGGNLKEKAIRWDYSSPRRINKLDASVEIVENDQSNNYYISANYLSQRFIADISNNMETNNSSESTWRTRTNLRSAFVFSGNNFALSRPITGSFVIVKPNKHLEKQTISLNDGYDDSDGNTYFFGNAVIPSLQPYRYYRLHLDSSDLKPGFSVGKEDYILLPKYRSGHSLSVGIPSTVLLSGRVFKKNGTPYSLEVGEVKRLDNNFSIPLKFFTNRKGRFIIEKMIPGKYQLYLYQNPNKKINFIIKKGTQGIHNTGILII